MSDIGLILGFISSLMLTLMPETRNYDITLKSEISLQRKRKNFQVKVFYRSMLLVFSIGFLLQYVNISLQKPSGQISFEIAISLFIVLFCAIIAYTVGLTFNHSLRMRVRYIPQFTREPVSPFNPTHTWMFIIENKNFKKIYKNAVLILPSNATFVALGESGKERKILENTNKIPIPTIEPRSKLFVIVQGLAASDAHISEGDAYLEISSIKKIIWPEVKSPLNLNEY